MLKQFINKLFSNSSTYSRKMPPQPCTISIKHSPFINFFTWNSRRKPWARWRRSRRDMWAGSRFPKDLRTARSPAFPRVNRLVWFAPRPNRMGQLPSCSYRWRAWQHADYKVSNNDIREKCAQLWLSHCMHVFVGGLFMFSVKVKVVCISGAKLSETNLSPFRKSVLKPCWLRAFTSFKFTL